MSAPRRPPSLALLLALLGAAAHRQRRAAATTWPRTSTRRRAHRAGRARSTSWRSTPTARSPAMRLPSAASSRARRQLDDAASRDPGAPFATDARFTRLMNNAAAVLQGARRAVGCRASPRTTPRASCRACSPRPRPWRRRCRRRRSPQVTGALERFEVARRRLQLDVAALTAGTGDPGQAAQRIAESQRLPRPGDLGVRRAPTSALGAAAHHRARGRQAPEDPGCAVHRARRGAEARGRRGSGAAGGADRGARDRRGRPRHRRGGCRPRKPRRAQLAAPGVAAAGAAGRRASRC